VGAIETAMGRTPGGIVSFDQAISGALKYLKAEGLDQQVVHKYQGTIKDINGNPVTTGDYTSSGVTVKRDGPVTTFKWICDQLQSGEDVEIFVIWRQSGSVFGHTARVWGCGMVNGNTYLKILDDAVQGDDTEETYTTNVLVSDSSQGVKYQASQN